MAGHALVVGESLVDVVRAADGTERAHPGGSAANVAVALARLGRTVRLATSYADDEHGALVAAHLGRACVEPATDPRVITRTSSATAKLDDRGAASYDFDLEWRLGVLLSEEESVVVHVCSLGAVLEPGCVDVLALVRELRAGATITYDVNVRPAVTGTGPDLADRVQAMIELADLVKASDEDLAALRPEADPLATARGLLRQGASCGPSVVVLTRGDEGATWVDELGEVEVDAVPVTVADTIGAGDTFGAGLIDALWTRDRLGADRRSDLVRLPRAEVEAVLAHAARVSAVTVSRPGADPPYAHELA